MSQLGYVSDPSCSLDHVELNLALLDGGDVTRKVRYFLELNIREPSADTPLPSP